MNDMNSGFRRTLRGIGYVFDFLNGLDALVTLVSAIISLLSF
jgi:hypothetical protein